LIDLLEVDRHT